MFKDDQMISILTGIVLMIVIGTMIQRADGFSFLSSEEPTEVTLGDDRVDGRVNRLVQINVLDNDKGLGSSPGVSPVMVTAPACGQVFVQDRVLQYLPGDECAGEQVFSYTVADAPPDVSASVTVSVAGPRGQQVAAIVPVVPAVNPRTSETVERRDPPNPQVAAVVRRKLDDTEPSYSVPRDLLLSVPADSGPGDLLVAGLLPSPGLETPARPERQARLTPARQKLPRDPSDVQPLAGDDLPLPVAGVPQEIGDVLMAAFDRRMPFSGGETADRSGLPGWLSVLPELVGVSVSRSPQKEVRVGLPEEPLPATVVVGPEFSLPQTRAPKIDSDPDLQLALLYPSTVETPQGVALEPLMKQPLDASEELAPFGAGRETVPEGSGPQYAALTKSAVDCVTPPATVLDVRRAAMTEILVTSPCHADTVAALTYSGVEYAISLDGLGEGRIMSYGFDANTSALITFNDGETLDFDLPFRGIDRVTRVAMVWDTSVALGLNALEFGARLGSAGHIHGGNPRSFNVARRDHGGFLTRYRPVAGIGDNVEIYTFWHQRSSGPGVVKLSIDYRDQPAAIVDIACGGRAIQPEITILRTERGTALRPAMRKLPPMTCSHITRKDGDNQLIFGAVDDVVILQR